jgi:hypothetical protein
MSDQTRAQSTLGTVSVQPDDWRINMNDAWQVLWWCRFLGLSKSQLEATVLEAGTLIVDIKRHLSRKQVQAHDSREKPVIAEQAAVLLTY